MFQNDLSLKILVIISFVSSVIPFYESEIRNKKIFSHLKVISVFFESNEAEIPILEALTIIYSNGMPT